jgi:hypothetical protein
MFEAPVYSKQSRTKSTERPRHHQHFEQKPTLLFERTRHPYVGISPQIDHVVEEPQSKPRPKPQHIHVVEEPSFSETHQSQNNRVIEKPQTKPRPNTQQNIRANERAYQPTDNIPIHDDEPQFSPTNTQNIRFVEKPEEKQQSPVPSKPTEEPPEKVEENPQEPEPKIEEDYPDPNALKERLKLYGMKEKTPIRGDGNCQFAAFSDQYFGDIKYAADIRKKCVEWLWENKDFVLSNGAKIEHFLQTDFFPTWRDYCEYMIQDGTWGDNLTLVALSELFQTKIVIISSIKLSKNQNPCTVIVPSQWNESENKVVYLSHLHELHYSSICQDEDF